VLARFDTREYRSRGGTVARELGREDHPGPRLATLEPLAEERLSRLRVPPTVAQESQDLTGLLHRPPPIMACATEREEHRLPGPLFPRLRPSVAPLIGLRVANRAVPCPARFVSHHAPTGESPLFHLAVAQAAAAVEPHAVAAELGRKPLMVVGSGWCGGRPCSAQDSLLGSGALLPRPRRDAHGTRRPRRAQAVQRGTVKLTMPDNVPRIFLTTLRHLPCLTSTMGKVRSVSTPENSPPVRADLE
jgi:hypothetical protein